MYDINNVYECTFVKRLNRFVATVLLDGEKIDVHVKNTGRCKELLLEGTKGYLVKSDNPKRKYAYDLVAIYKGKDLVNFDSQIPNYAVYQFLKKETLFKNIVEIKREVTYGKSRFDIYLEHKLADGTIEKVFVEVKGVTLYEEEVASFPDAPTERGTKHVNELVECLQEGYKTYILFVAQVSHIQYFKPNRQLDPKFSLALQNAANAGVGVLCYNCIVDKSGIIIKDKVEVILEEK